MSHYNVEGFENVWKLIRETPSSQRFTVLTPEKKELAVDIHFTPSKILTVTICGIGADGDFSKSVLTPVMEDISKIALRRADYAVIDYSLCVTDRISDGNFSIEDKTREVYKL